MDSLDLGDSGARIDGLRGHTFGALLINRNFRQAHEQYDRALLVGSDPLVDIVNTRLDKLDRAERILYVTKVGFARMVRVTWCAMFVWLWLAVLVGLGRTG